MSSKLRGDEEHRVLSNGADNWKRSNDCCAALCCMLERDAVAGGLVGVAGSYALHRWCLQRWNRAPGLHGENWPNDVDIFVGSDLAGSKNEFVEFVNRCLERCTRSGYVVERDDERRNFYVYENEATLIRTVELAGIGVPFQFIMCFHERRVENVVARFDINICQVLCYPHDNKFVLSEEVEECIEDKKAVCKNFKFRSTCPSMFEIKKVERSLSRMMKYSRRGFSFPRYPRLSVVRHPLNENVTRGCHLIVEE